MDGGRRDENTGDDRGPAQGTWFDRLPLLVALMGGLMLVALLLIVVTVDTPADPVGAGLEADRQETCMAASELAAWYDDHPEAYVLDGKAEDGRICLVYMAAQGDG